MDSRCRVPLEASGSQLSYEKAARQLAERQMAQCSHEAAELFETSISWLFSKVEVLTYVWLCTLQKSVSILAKYLFPHSFRPLCFVQVTQADLDAHDTGSRESQKKAPVILLMEEIRRSPVELLVVLTIIYRGFIHPRWCRISSINSIDYI